MTAGGQPGVENSLMQGSTGGYSHSRVMGGAGLNSLGSSSVVGLRNGIGGAKSTNTTMTMTSINGFRDTNGSLIAHQTSQGTQANQAIPIQNANSSFYNQNPRAERSTEAYRRGH